MTFLRRGNVSFPHKASASITLKRRWQYPVQILLKDISCFEEHRVNLFDTITMIYFVNGSSYAVEESFDEVASSCQKWEVANV